MSVVCPSGYVSPNIRARTFFFVAKFDLGIVVRLDFLPSSSTMNVLFLKLEWASSYIACKSKVMSAHSVKAYGEWRYSSTHSQYWH